MENFTIYLTKIEKAFNSRLATEHTYRPALIDLIQSFGKDYQIINEPKRRTFGAPDYIVRKREIPLGYIETKDIGKDLDKLDKREKEQLKKYLDSLDNIIYTNYLDFRWFVRGEIIETIALAEISRDGKFQIKTDAEKKLTNLFEEFLQKEVSTVSTPQELASRMASITRLIRQTIEKAMEDNEVPKDNTLYEQFESFQKTLLPNLKQNEFADLYSQTIAYGLFTARCFDTNLPFTRQKAAYLIPKTNPFLRDTFDRIGGIHLDERITWAVDDLAEILNRTEIETIIKDFGKRKLKEDPVYYFYEDFISEYDPKLRRQRGVYYTPEPVVSYIVRSVDKILQDDFGLTKGLADSSRLEDGSHRVLILDPATGTGTFLYNVIKNIAGRFENNKGMWEGYVSENLLPRIFGFELLVAPYAVAHLKLGLLLEETGYKFDTDERLRIYLNNTLDFTSLREDGDAFSAFINNEAKEGREIQQDKPVMVILGNPPYSGHSANKGKWITDLLHGSDSLNAVATDNYFTINGKPLDERNPKWLNDDYVKFIRFSQWRIEQTGYGIMAFITNHSYLDNPTFRGMRESLTNTFDKIYVLDLHGNSNKKEKPPENIIDKNVFDIKQGVSIAFFIKLKDKPNKKCEVYHSEIWGNREEKYSELQKLDIQNTNWFPLKEVDRDTCLGKMYFYTPVGFDNIDEYCEYPKITDVFLNNSVGIVTGRDNLVIDFEKSDLIKKIKDFADLSKSDTDIKNKYLRSSDKLPLQKVRKEINSIGSAISNLFFDCFYSPFDTRTLFYHQAVLERHRDKIMQHFINRNNLGLIVPRKVVNDFHHTFVSKNITAFNSLDSAGSFGAGYLFPLYIYPSIKQSLFDDEFEEFKPNFSNEFIFKFSAKLKKRFAYRTDNNIYMVTGEKDFYGATPRNEKLDAIYEKSDLIKPEDIFNYIYAIFHSPLYRYRYAEFLKIDFPRLPITSNYKLFLELADLGKSLVDIHLLEKDIEPEVTFPKKGSDEVQTVKFEVTKEEGYMEENKFHIERFGKVWINEEQFFDNVPETSWEFYIGGYQILDKWLKDRKGKKLRFNDIEHYTKVVSALMETVKLMTEIDERVEESGGFPIM